MTIHSTQFIIAPLRIMGSTSRRTIPTWGTERRREHRGVARDARRARTFVIGDSEKVRPGDISSSIDIAYGFQFRTYDPFLNSGQLNSMLI
jgi:hypothetical protein